MFNSKVLVDTEVLINASGSKLRLVMNRGRLFRRKKLYLKLGQSMK